MLLSLIDILGSLFIIEPLLYLILPDLFGRLTLAGRVFQVIDLLFFISAVFA